jgi:hypothetical protein
MSPHSKITSDKARLEYLSKAMERTAAAMEKYLRKEYRANFKRCLKKLSQKAKRANRQKATWAI